MDGPLPFIVLSPESIKNRKEGKDDPKRKFVFHEESCKIIENLKRKVTVITIAGLYRTGKSFILNKLANSNGGFDIGSTIEPCTQGIWMWVINPDKINHPAFPKDTDIILLDTEGLGSYTKSKTYDIQIFSLAVLLSSFFVYNSVGSIDETALDRLSLVVELTKHIKSQADSDVESPSDLNAFFPKFMWLVRDFSLKLQSGGKDISPKEYLENSLAPLPGDPSKVKDKNLIRSSITQFFVDRTCFTLKRPVNDEALLQHLETASDSDFRPQFLEELKELIQLIYSGAKPKKLYRENLNGAMFIHLARNYVQAINEGSIPVIRTAWENVVEVENQKALSEAFKIYTQSIEEGFKDNSILETRELDTLHENSLEKSMETFNRLVKGDFKTKFEKKLMDQVRQLLKQKTELNIANSKKFCDNLLDNIVSMISNSIEEGKVETMDHLQKLWEETLETQFDKVAKGPQKDLCLSTHLRRKPIDHSRRVLGRNIADLQKKHEEEIEQIKRDNEQEVAKVEKLYNSVLTSWERTKADLGELDTENKQLISSIVHLSEAF